MLLKVPEDIDMKLAAAMMLQGMTAYCFTHYTTQLKPKDRVLVHAGAGGLGSLLLQIARRIGCETICTVSTVEKAVIAKEYCDVVIITGKAPSDCGFVVSENVTTTIAQLGKVDVVYDGVGKDTYLSSLACLKPLGHLVLCGNASGAVPPIDPLDLMRAGSITMTRPSLPHYFTLPGGQIAIAEKLFELMRSGLKVHITEYKLEDAGVAMKDLVERRTIGKCLLTLPL